MSLIEDIALLEENLNDLIIKYEQYFLGLEKREPIKHLEQVEQSFRRYRNINIVNTMLKFKLNTLAARFSTYKRHWTRITRLIEEGRYSREKFRMQMKLQGMAQPAGHEDCQVALEPVSEVDEIYTKFLEARQACNLPVNTISRDVIAEALEKQRPLIRQKYNCDKIRFTVVIEDGKPKIKARPDRPDDPKIPY